MNGDALVDFQGKLYKVYSCDLAQDPHLSVYMKESAGGNGRAEVTVSECCLDQEDFRIKQRIVCVEQITAEDSLYSQHTHSEPLEASTLTFMVLSEIGELNYIIRGNLL